MSETGKTSQAHCNSCGQETSHHVLASKRRHQTSDDGEVWADTTFEFLECAGCEEVAVRRSYVFSESIEDGPEITMYPPSVSRHTPDWRWALPREIGSLMDEVYSALHVGSRRIATMGARALIDMAMVDKVGDAGTFSEKLRALHMGGYISDLNRTVLEAALDLGNAAAHRGHSPTTKQLDTVMDIVENLLQTIFVLMEDAEELRRTTPPRQRP